MVIAFYMAEFHHVAEILKGPKGDALLFLTTFILTVLIDITVAVEIGVLLAALFFMKRMADTASISRHSLIDQENDRKEKMPHNAIFKQEKVEGIELLQINGPLFFGASDLLSSQVTFPDKEIKIIILTLTSVPMIDLTGIKALQLFYERCHNARLLLLLAGVAEKVKESLQQTGFSKKIGKEHIFSDIDEAMKFAKKRV
jgi:SulP family sulfate permease